MLEIMKAYKKEIENYCIENNLSIDKVFSTGMSYDEESVLLQPDTEPEEGVVYMIDYPSTPSPIALEIYLENGKLRFVQTPLTYEYLSADRASARELAFA
jgi:hypothetical protein